MINKFDESGLNIVFTYAHTLRQSVIDKVAFKLHTGKHIFIPVNIRYPIRKIIIRGVVDEV